MSELTFFNGHVVCPRCDGNGLIYKVMAIDINEILFTCDECEACWPLDVEISLITFEDLSTYLDKKGTNYRTCNLINLGYDWYVS